MANTHAYATCPSQNVEDIEMRDQEEEGPRFQDGQQTSDTCRPTQMADLDQSHSNIGSSQSSPNGASAPVTVSIPASDQESLLDLSSSGPSIHDTNRRLPLLPRSSMKWKKTWKIPIEIMGLYVFALTIAIAHLCFFNYLDGRFITDEVESPAKSTSIPQAYVTTISLLLVTTFRAALVASVGTCYTQHLWAVLRRQTLKIQTSASHFSNYRLALKTPTLMLVAAFCWLVPLATLYPPGALIVDFGSSIIHTRFNVSVFHRTDLRDNSSSLARFSYLTPSEDEVYTQSLPPDYKDAKHWLNGFKVELPNSTEIAYVARSVLLSGEVVNLDRPSGPNSTYDLDFWGTTIDCKTTNQTIYRTLDRRDYYHSMHKNLMGVYDYVTIYNLTYIGDKSEGKDRILANRTIYYEEDGSLSGLDSNHSTEFKLRYYPCYDLEGAGSRYLQNPEENTVYAPEINTIESKVTTICTPKIVRYYVTIAHSGGNQHVSYEIRDEGSNLDYNLRFQNFDGDLEHWSQLSDAFTMYEAFGSILSKSSRLFSLVNVSQIVTPLGPYKLPNGTVVKTCDLKASSDFLASSMRIGRAYNQIQLETSLWKSSIFGRQSPIDSDYGIRFDPKLVNDVLAKTTISALSLNQRYAMVDGNETKAFNIYRFQRKLPLFLPYALSLSLALPIMALGLFALYIENNGTSAITGGFYQILMTTTGRTSLEAVIGKESGSMGGSENVSKQLSDMEIRFGELKDEVENTSKGLLHTRTPDYVHGIDGEEENDIEVEETGQGVLLHPRLATVEETDANCKRTTLRRRAGFGTPNETTLFLS